MGNLRCVDNAYFISSFVVCNPYFPQPFPLGTAGGLPSQLASYIKLCGWTIFEDSNASATFAIKKTLEGKVYIYTV